MSYQCDTSIAEENGEKKRKTRREDVEKQRERQTEWEEEEKKKTYRIFIKIRFGASPFFVENHRPNSFVRIVEDHSCQSTVDLFVKFTHAMSKRERTDDYHQIKH